MTVAEAGRVGWAGMLVLPLGNGTRSGPGRDLWSSGSPGLLLQLPPSIPNEGEEICAMGLRFIVRARCWDYDRGVLELKVVDA